MIIWSLSFIARPCFLVYVFSVRNSWNAITHRPSRRYVRLYKDCVRGVLACMAGRRSGGKTKWTWGGEVPYRGRPAFWALVFPLSLPFGRLPRRLEACGRSRSCSFSSFILIVCTTCQVCLSTTHYPRLDASCACWRSCSWGFSDKKRFDVRARVLSRLRKNSAFRAIVVLKKQC